MPGLRGNPATLRALAKSLQQEPRVLAQRTAARVAPVVSSMAQASYDGGQTVYGDARPAGVTGPLDLYVSGKTRGSLGAVAIGTIVRFVLSTRAARYLVGKYRILPMGAMPVQWSRAIGEIARQEAAAYFAKKAA